MSGPLAIRPREDRTDSYTPPYADNDRHIREMKEAQVTKICYFIALPPELRDVIYHHLWLYSPYIVSNQGSEGLGYLGTSDIVCGVVYGPSPSTKKTYWTQDRTYLTLTNPNAPPATGLLRPSKTPHWLLTRKFFLAEGLSKMHLEATWTPRSIDLTPVSLASTGLLNPAFAQKISINVLNASNWVPLWSANPHILAALQHTNYLQSLTLKVQYFMHTSMSHGTLHAAELDLLWALTNGGFEDLTEIVVQVQLQYEPGTEISQWDPRVYQWRLCREIPWVVDGVFGRDG
jgi:hypothetical protein